MAYSLNLLADVQLSGVEVDQLPGKPEDFTLAQAEDQDEHERGVQWFTLPRGLIRGTGVRDRQSLLDAEHGGIALGAKGQHKYSGKYSNPTDRHRPHLAEADL